MSYIYSIEREERERARILNSFVWYIRKFHRGLEEGGEGGEGKK